VDVKPRSKVLDDLIKEAGRYPTGWKAVFGRDQRLLSFDYYIFHPKVGLYLLKEYCKNPYTLEGVGGRIARRVDEDILVELSSYSGYFGVIQGDIRKIASNIEKGVHPKEILNAALEGRDLGVTIPLRGRASMEDERFKRLREKLGSKQKKIEEKFEKLAANEGLYAAYG